MAYSLYEPQTVTYKIVFRQVVCAPVKTMGVLRVGKKIAGKTFSKPEEAGGTAPTDEELARARRLFDEFPQRVEAVAPEDRPAETSPKFWDDVSGTEYRSEQDS